MRVVHISIELYVCTICENRYDCKEHLNEHINTEHETTYESQKVGLEVSTQTQSLPQVEHIEYFETLKKEHRELLCLYERQTAICEDQIQQIQEQSDQKIICQEQSQEIPKQKPNCQTKH